MKLESRMDHTVVPTGTASVVHVLLTLTAPDSPAGRKRPALNLAAVLDRSGSMAGEKLDYAKRSTQLLLDQLAPDDRFSLVTFDDEVQPLVESATVSDPTALSAAIAGIQAGNCTNLSGGWLKSIELVSRNASEECVNAVLLLTDGQANAGIVNPDQLTALGQNVLKDKNIRTSCLGLGADFNEDLLKRVSEAAGGRFYYIESPDHAPEVFKEELGGLLDTVTQNVEVSLDFTDGVIGVAQLTGHPWKAEKSSYRVLLSDFHAAQVKHVLLAVQLPALAEPTDMHLASLSMTYAELREGAVDLKSQSGTRSSALPMPSKRPSQATPRLFSTSACSRPQRSASMPSASWTTATQPQPSVCLEPTAIICANLPPAPQPPPCSKTRLANSNAVPTNFSTNRSCVNPASSWSAKAQTSYAPTCKEPFHPALATTGRQTPTVTRNPEVF